MKGEVSEAPGHFSRKPIENGASGDAICGLKRRGLMTVTQKSTSDYSELLIIRLKLLKRCSNTLNAHILDQPQD